MREPVTVSNESEAKSAAGAERYRVADHAPRRLADVLLRWESILVMLLIAVIIGNIVKSPYFLDPYNLADATYNFSEKAIIALVMALLILVREIDLSVAAIVALSALVVGFLGAAGYGPFVLIVAGIAIGGLCGAFNGFLVTRSGVPSIVITIGTMSLFRGLAQVSLGDQALTTYPQAFLDLGQTYFIDWPPVPLSNIVRPAGVSRKVTMKGLSSRVVDSIASRSAPSTAAWSALTIQPVPGFWRGAKPSQTVVATKLPTRKR